MELTAVAIPCGDQIITLGVFENEQVAKTKLEEWGAVYKQYPRRHPYYIGSERNPRERNPLGGQLTGEMSEPRLETTPKFIEFMQSRNLHTYQLDEGSNFCFIPMKLNELCIGYNDD